MLIIFEVVRILTFYSQIINRKLNLIYTNLSTELNKIVLGESLV